MFDVVAVKEALLNGLYLTDGATVFVHSPKYKPKNVYVVGGLHTEVIEPDDCRTVGIIEDWLETIERDPSIPAVGAWRNPANGNIYLDALTIIHDDGTSYGGQIVAAGLGYQRQEIAVGHFNDAGQFTEIQTGVKA